MPSSDMNEINRDIGALSTQVRIMAETLIKMEKKLDDVERSMSEARGGWKYLSGILILAGSIGGIVSTFVKIKVTGI